jgi:hypothetical protein
MIKLASVNFLIVLLVVIFGFGVVKIVKNHLQD